MKNEGKTGITSLEWDSGTGPSHTNRLVFADKDGHVGMFDVLLPKETAAEKTDPLVDDSLLMEVGWHGNRDPLEYFNYAQALAFYQYQATAVDV